MRLCFGCAPYQAGSVERKALSSRVGNAIIWGLLTAWISVDRGGPIAGAVFWLALVLSAPLNTILHEIGHALAARTMGLDVLSVTVGRGPEILARRMGPIRFSLRRYVPTGGLTHFILPAQTSRWRQATVFAGGALANLLVAGGLLALDASLDGPADPWLRAMIVPAVAGLAVANLGAVVMTLWPTSSGEHLSDGAQIVALFRAKPSSTRVQDPRLALMVATQRLILASRFTEAADLFAAKLSEWPNDPYLLGMVIHCTSRVHGDQAAMVRYADLVAIAPAGPPREFDGHAAMTGWLAANIAWSTLKSGSAADSEAADKQLRTALSRLPDAPEAKATFGALQVLTGEPASGERLLIQALRTVVDSRDRADFCAYVAQARRALGDADGAVEAERLREHIATTALERPAV